MIDKGYFVVTFLMYCKKHCHISAGHLLTPDLMSAKII